MQNQNPHDEEKQDKEPSLLKRLLEKEDFTADPPPPNNDVLGQEFNFPIPTRFERCSLDNYNPQPPVDSDYFVSQAMALLECKRLAHEFPCVDSGLLLSGNCGVGKTHLAVALLKEFKEKTWMPVTFVDCGSLLRNIRDSYKQDDCWEGKILAPIYQSEVVLLDNLGGVNPSAWAMETLTIFINTLYNKNTLLIATTNFLDTPSDCPTLAEVVGTRVRSRLLQMCKHIRIHGEDYRRDLSTNKRR